MESAESLMMAYEYPSILPEHVPHTLDMEDRNSLVPTDSLGYRTALPLEQFCRTPTLEPHPVDPVSGFPIVAEYAQRCDRQYPVVHSVRIPASLSTPFQVILWLDHSYDYRRRRRRLAFS